MCPFCRTELPATDTEFLERLYKQIDKYKDPNAMTMVGSYYMNGERGLPKNPKKAEEIFKRAYDLGDPTAAHLLSMLYSDDIPDQARMMKYEEEGARRGHTGCMNNVALRAGKSNNNNEATRLMMKAARSGDDFAMNYLMILFRNGFQLLSKEDIATTVRAHKAVTDKVKSEAREYAERYQNFKLNTATARAKKKKELEKAGDLIKNKKKKKKKKKT